MQEEPRKQIIKQPPKRKTTSAPLTCADVLAAADAGNRRFEEFLATRHDTDQEEKENNNQTIFKGIQTRYPDVKY